MQKIFFPLAIITFNFVCTGLFAQAKAELPFDWEKLLAKEIQVEPVKQADSNRPGVRMIFAVTAPQSLIWHTISNTEVGREIFSQNKDMVILEKKDTYEIATYNMNLFFKKYQYILRRTMDKANLRVDWINTGGDLKYICGFWQIRQTPAPDTFLLIYEVFIDSGFRVPQWLQQIIQMQESKKMALTLRNWLESQGNE